MLEMFTPESLAQVSLEERWRLPVDGSKNEGLHCLEWTSCAEVAFQVVKSIAVQFHVQQFWL
jgi:hypothetical protein